MKHVNLSTIDAACPAVQPTRGQLALRCSRGAGHSIAGISPDGRGLKRLSAIAPARYPIILCRHLHFHDAASNNDLLTRPWPIVSQTISLRHTIFRVYLLHTRRSRLPPPAHRCRFYKGGPHTKVTGHFTSNSTLPMVTGGVAAEPANGRGGLPKPWGGPKAEQQQH